jgi:hypothetical protein
MEIAEKRELQDSLQAMLAGIAEDPGAVGAELRELGWDEVVAEDAAASALLFEELGRAGVASSLLDETVLAVLGVDATSTAVAYPLNPVDPLWEPHFTASGSALPIDAVLRHPGSMPQKVAFAVGTNQILVLPTAELTLSAVTGLDETGGWSRVLGDLTIDPAWSVDTQGSWRDAVRQARLLVAAELVGLARAALALATAHVTDRQQFGRAIGSFQAVRFRLAETKVAIEASAEAIRLGFEDGSAVTAVVAKTLAGNAAEAAVRNAAQVCGAMGLTWEFGLHAIIRRSFAIDQLLGSSSVLTTALGRYIAETTERPLLDPLAVPLDR